MEVSSEVSAGDPILVVGCKNSSNGSSVTLSLDKNVYWFRANETKTIKAWWYKGVNTNTYPTWTVKADQESNDNYQASDFIEGTLSLNFADRDDENKKIIHFKHKTARIVVKIDAGSSYGGFKTDDLKSATIKIENISGVESNGSSIDAMHPVTDDVYSKCALVMPQTVPVGVNFITIIVGGTEYHYKAEEGKNVMEAGTEYTYTITVRGTKLEVTTPGGIPWGQNGNEGSGTVGI